VLLQVDHERRKNWDDYAGDLVVLDRDKLTNSRLLHWIMKYPVSLCVRKRDPSGRCDVCGLGNGRPVVLVGGCDGIVYWPVP